MAAFQQRGSPAPCDHLGDVDCSCWSDVEEQVWLGLVK